MSIKESFTDYIYQLQDEICSTLEQADGNSSFEEDLWERPGGGGGRTRVIRNGAIFEKGGVNISTVHGSLNDALKKQLSVSADQFYACGLSLVIHPENPMVPTTHANFRYFEVYNEKGKVADQWFGGGIDLTPYYLWEEDAIYFHQQIKEVCDVHGEELYPRFKEDCDVYFFNHHRNESRGIGGVFFDYLKPDEKRSANDWMNFTRDVGNLFANLYVTIVNRRKNESYTPANKEWQEIRRGRYVEFNLIHDKGTLFGLRSNGRTESILMSLPPTVRWEYDHNPEEGSREWELLQGLKPRDWASMSSLSSTIAS